MLTAIIRPQKLFYCVFIIFCDRSTRRRYSTDAVDTDTVSGSTLKFVERCHSREESVQRMATNTNMKTSCCITTLEFEHSFCSRVCFYAGSMRDPCCSLSLSSSCFYPCLSLGPQPRSSPSPPAPPCAASLCLMAACCC